MIKPLYILSLILLVSCGQHKSNTTKNLIHQIEPEINGKEAAAVRTYPLSDKIVRFLWVAEKYDQELKRKFNSIFINDAYCKTISDPKRAALGFVAAFIGNECWWDGDEAKEDRSNLKCKILTALDLGYQCSDRHLGFLRKWFKNDQRSLNELIYCSKMNNE